MALVTILKCNMCWGVGEHKVGCPEHHLNKGWAEKLFPGRLGMEQQQDAALKAKALRVLSQETVPASTRPIPREMSVIHHSGGSVIATINGWWMEKNKATGVYWDRLEDEFGLENVRISGVSALPDGAWLDKCTTWNNVSLVLYGPISYIYEYGAVMRISRSGQDGLEIEELVYRGRLVGVDNG